MNLNGSLKHENEESTTLESFPIKELLSLLTFALGA